MGAPNPMFKVIVLGGIALVDCGARTDLGHRLVADAAVDAKDDAPGLFYADAGSPALDATRDVAFPGEL